MAPLTQYMAPLTQYMAPLTQFMAPLTQYMAQLTQYMALLTQYMAPLTQYMAPLTQYIAPLTQTAINKFKISLPANSDQLKLTISTLKNVQFLLLPSIQVAMNPRALNSEVDNLFVATEKH